MYFSIICDTQNNVFITSRIWKTRQYLIKIFSKHGHPLYSMYRRPIIFAPGLIKKRRNHLRTHISQWFIIKWTFIWFDMSDGNLSYKMYRYMNNDLFINLFKIVLQYIKIESIWYFWVCGLCVCMIQNLNSNKRIS